MIELKKKNLPSAVPVDGVFYSVHTDFRFWLLFPELFRPGNELKDLDIFYNGEIPENREAGAIQLLKFYQPEQKLPRPTGRESGKVVDYEQDEDLIYSAFYQQYKIDLKEVDLHWHKFLVLFSGLKDTKLNDIINTRLYNGTDTELIQAREAWRLEEELSEEEQKQLDYFNSL